MLNDVFKAHELASKNAYAFDALRKLSMNTSVASHVAGLFDQVGESATPTPTGVFNPGFAR